jgi:acetyltransferase
LLRVETLEELFDSAETLALAERPSGRHLAIVTNGGALGVLAVDALFDLGGKLAQLGGDTLARLERILPPAWSHANPIDIVGDATPARFEQTLEAVLDDAEVDGVLVLHCPTAVSLGVEAAQAVAAVAARRPNAAVLTSWVGEKSAADARRELQTAGVPTYETPERAVDAFMRMIQHRHDEQALLGEDSAPPGEVLVNHAAARRIFEHVRGDRREWLTQPEARDVLAAYAIPTGHVVEAATPEEAAQAAAALGGAVVLKIAAPEIIHKSDVEGVVVGLVGASAVRQAAVVMLDRVRALRPDAVLRGFTVEPMVDRDGGLELIVGATTGGDFGPVVLFGEGGTAVEAIGDTALELAPIGVKLARELVARTRVYKRMRGYRNVPAVDVDAVVDVIVRVSRLLADFPQILEMDINPLFSTEAGCTALDVRIKIALGPESAWPRFSIA